MSAATEVEWADLTDEEREVYVAAARDATDDLWVCTRTWDAWSVGTMTEADFRRASDDEDTVNDVAAAAYAAGAGLRAEIARLRVELASVTTGGRAAEREHDAARDELARLRGEA